MKITIKLLSLKIIDNGDPNHETHGELFYSFKVNGGIIASKSKTTPQKVKDGEVITLGQSKQIKNITKTSSPIIFDGFVGDVDTGFNGKNERDTFKVRLNRKNNWKEGTNSIILQDGRLRVTLKFSVQLDSETDTISFGPQEAIRPEKSASLTIVSFEDSKFYNLVQNAHNNYGHAFDGYEKSVLIKLVYNELQQPTKHVSDISTSSILNELKMLADEGYFIDLFIHSHGTKNKITFKDPHRLKPEDIASLCTGDYSNGRFPLRMIYQVNCNGSTLNDDWLDAGAKVVCGAADINFYPNQYNKFMREWNDGERFDTAIHNSNTASARTAMQMLIAIDARTSGYACPPFKTVLNKARCAKRYFEDVWLGENGYNENLKGKENMNISSTMVISGNANLRKSNTNLTW